MNQHTISSTGPSSRRTDSRFDGLKRTVVGPLKRRRVRVPELAIGTFVIAAAIAASVILNADEDSGTDVLAVGQDVSRGQVIDAAHLTVISLDTDRDVALLASELSPDVVGMRAAVDLEAGTPLSSSHLVSIAPLSRREALVGMVLDDSRAPVDLAPGDLVEVKFLDTSLENGDVVSSLPKVAEVWSVTMPDDVMGERSISLRVDRVLSESFVGHDEIHLVKVVN